MIGSPKKSRYQVVTDRAQDYVLGQCPLGQSEYDVTNGSPQYQYYYEENVVFDKEWRCSCIQSSSRANEEVHGKREGDDKGKYYVRDVRFGHYTHRYSHFLR